MGILEQIDSFMYKKIISDHGYKIDYFSVLQSVKSDNLNYFMHFGSILEQLEIRDSAMLSG